MPTELTKADAQSLAPQWWDSREMLDTLKQTVCRGATDAQFRMFLEVCKGTGLNPFLKEIWFVPNVGVMAGRDGYLRVANEHPMFNGMETLVERDKEGMPIKATCKVWRKDREHPVTCEAYYNEYRKDSQVWKTYKSAMISKVAEVLALKRSFSINGLVTEEEIGEPAPPKPRTLAEIEQRHAAEVHEAEVVIEEESHSKKPRKRGAVSFDAMKSFGVLKKEFLEVARTTEPYYAILSSYGFAHADEISDTQKAREIYKAMASKLNELKQDNQVQDLLEKSCEQLGVGRFMQILGANGCETITEALQLAGDPLETLLRELKLAVEGV